MSAQDPYRRDPAGSAGPTPYGQVGYGAPPYGSPQPPYGYPQSPYDYRGHGSNGLGVTGLVLGILALFFFWAAAGVWLGIPAIIFGVVGRQRARRGEAAGGGISLAGVICGGIAMVLTVVFFAVLFAANAAGGIRGLLLVYG